MRTSKNGWLHSTGQFISFGTQGYRWSAAAHRMVQLRPDFGESLAADDAGIRNGAKLGSGLTA
jgi:hypothetical protein